LNSTSSSKLMSIDKLFHLFARSVYAFIRHERETN
jgi:hypothetical protein